MLVARQQAAGPHRVVGRVFLEVGETGDKAVTKRPLAMDSPWRVLA